MAYKCDNCSRGVAHGHMVSHAKNRLGRLFKPNLQKLKVLKNGVAVRVKFCASCIKRLKKDGHTGIFGLLRLRVPALAVSLPIKSVLKKTIEKEVKVKKVKELKVEKAKETLDISAIVGKKN